MTRSCLAMLTVASAVLIGSTYPVFAQEAGMPIISNISLLPSELDRGLTSFASSPALASPLPVAMTPNLFSGALNTSVSIDVPRAKGRAMPPLALTYNSLRGEGTLGVGWILTAGSIVRSQRFGIDYAGNTFVLTLGSKSVDLIDVGGGIYRDKLDTLRLEAIQIASTAGVFSWRVTDAYGTKYFFGSVEGSRRERPIASLQFNAGFSVSGITTEISEWHLDRIEDLSGNYSILEYQIDSRYLYLKAVAFTGNTGVPLNPQNRVDISYESRPAEELIPSFMTNYESRTALRVRSIDISARGRAYASYVLSYTQSTQTKRSLLTGISRTAPEAAPPPPSSSTVSNSATTVSVPITTITFAYSDRQRADKWTVDSLDGPTREALMYHQCLPGDFNGDGKTDLACATNTTGEWSVGISRRTNENPPSNSSSNHKFSGLDTVPWQGPVVAKTLRLSVPLSSPILSGQPGRVVTVPDIRSSCFTGDVNGDNITDVVCYDESHRQWQIGISTGQQFLVKTWSTSPTLGPTSTLEPVSGSISRALRDQCIPADFNGDGLTDLACLVSGVTNAGLWSVALVRPNGWQTDNGWTIADWPNGAAPPATLGATLASSCRPGDFNGDRRADIACYDATSKTWYVAISTGSGFSTAPWPVNSGMPAMTTASQTAASRCLDGDFNGDGKTDLACYDHSDNPHPREHVGRWWVLLSTGFNWRTTPTPWDGPPINIPMRPGQDIDVTSQCFTGDFNGDGKNDLACSGTFEAPRANPGGWWTESVAGHDRFLSSKVQLGGESTLGTASSFGSCMAGDFNGDAKTDLLCDRGWSGHNEYELSSPDNSDTDLLTSVRTATGLTASFEYASSSDQLLSKVGFAIPVVTRMSLNIGVMTTAMNYEYENGAYDTRTREFRGFNHVKITHSKTLNEHQRVDDIWFFQGAGLNANEPTLPLGLEDLAAGMPYRQVLSDGSQQRLAMTFRYEGRSLTPSASSSQTVRLVERRTSFSGDPDANPDRIRTFDYDPNGNIAYASDTDLKTPGGTSVRIRATYSDDRHVHALAYPLTVEVSDRANPRLRYISYRYDTATCGAQPKAHSFLLTSLSHWIDGTSTAEQRFGYGKSGNLECIVDEYGGSTSLVYDSHTEYLLSITNPLHHKTSFTYYGVNDDGAASGLAGLLRTVATNSGRDVTHYEYDFVGRLTRIIKPDTSWIRIDYNYVGDPSRQHVRLESSAGLVRMLYRDGLGRVYRSLGTGPGGKTVSVTKEYDPAGWVVGIDEPQLIDDPGVSPASRARLRFEYDAFGRLLAANDSTGRVSQRCYDGLQAISLDANGHARRTTSDVLGRPVQVEEFEGKFDACHALGQLPAYTTTVFTYDGLGRLQRVTKEGAAVSEFTYDGRGNVTRIKNVDRGVVRFLYDVSGRLRRVNQAGQSPIKYGRDLLGRLKEITTPINGGTRQLWGFSYDKGPHAEGLLTSTIAPNYKATYDYDELGNNIGHIVRIDGLTYTLRRQYDDAGRIRAVDYPDGRQVTYAYDGPVLASITDGVRSLFVARDFNAYLQPGRLELGNGAVETFDYGLGRDRTAANPDPCAPIPSGELCRISTSLAGNPLRSILYRYDNALNVSSKEDSVDGTHMFTYDALDRLTSELTKTTTTDASSSGAPTTYAYDALGRRLSTSFQGTYQYDRDTPAARPSSPTSFGAVRVQSDGLGHVIRIGASRHDFNILGHLTRVTTPDHPSVTYSYDWLGNLLQRKRALSTVTFPNPYLVCKKGRCDNLVIGYGGVSAKLTPNGAQYYHLDHLGTRFAVTTSDGLIKSSLSYSAYGVLASPKADDGQFAGHWWDAESGLYWFSSRFYAPAIGQFLSPDDDSRLMAGVTNPHQYAFNNPLRWIDPDGHQEFPTTAQLPGGGMGLGGGPSPLGGLGTIGGPSPAGGLGNFGGGGLGAGGMGNMFPPSGGGGAFGDRFGPNFGGGTSSNAAPYSSPIGAFFFAAGSSSFGTSRMHGEGVILVGSSTNGGLYIGGMLLSGVERGGLTRLGVYSGREFTLDSSLSVHSAPITVMEVNKSLVSFGRYVVGGSEPEWGSFVSVGPEHAAVGVGWSDGFPDAAKGVLLRMVAPVGALQDPSFGCCDGPPY